MTATQRTPARPLLARGLVCAARQLAGLLVATAALMALGACGSGGGHDLPAAATTLDSATQPGPYGVGVTTIEVVDTSRPTLPGDGFAGSNERKITLEVWYPAAPSSPKPEARDTALERSGAPYPLIVFAHGFIGTRRQSVAYTQHLASHGYIVAAPDFPESNAGAPGGPRLSGTIQQPRDMSFVIDRMLAFNKTGGNLFEGAVDENAIGISGHSLGGLTVALTVFGPARDARVKAAVPLAPASCFLPDGYAGNVSVPLLELAGSDDLIVPMSSSRRAYDVANPPKYFVELKGGDHIRFADFDLDDSRIDLNAIGFNRSGFVSDAVKLSQEIGGGVASCLPSSRAAPDPFLSLARQQEILRAFATLFFDAYLRGSGEALAFLQNDLPGLVPEARVESVTK